MAFVLLVLSFTQYVACDAQFVVQEPLPLPQSGKVAQSNALPKHQQTANLGQMTQTIHATVEEFFAPYRHVDARSQLSIASRCAEEIFLAVEGP
jgi:hypothetical protein